MRRSDRHHQILTLLREAPHLRAEDLAAALKVSLRTIYRDMAALEGAGLPVFGTVGRGYALTQDIITLPPLNVSLAELEALHIGIAILADADDPQLRAAAQSLSQKVDAALPETFEDGGATWGLTALAVSGHERAIQWRAPLQLALRKRQKVALRTEAGEIVFRPYSLEYFGRIWRVQGFNDTNQESITLPLTAIQALRPLPELFPAPKSADI